ncbi:hypothetical protein ACGRHY_28630 [Streptomyces sp. HK10]|uniref:hypothetical protein n=1 Tax=Streptomyces sp. HK10 TaxID=3373255 RepID=UPI003747B1B9
MTRIEEILSRALLVRDRTMPRDIVPSSTPTTAPDPYPADNPPTRDTPPSTAAEDLRALCETLVTHTPPAAIAKFVTNQVPDPRSALILACILQLTDTDDGARYWWEYAAGAGQAAAAYCLYLHHLALGEHDAAHWWHRQTDDVQPAPKAPAQEHHPDREHSRTWPLPGHRVTTSTSITTILRILRHLAKYTARPRSATVAELMAYLPTAVATGYLRQPDIDLPLPGPDFASRIRTLLSAAAHRPDIPSRLPARPGRHERATHGTGQPASRLPLTKHTQTVPPQMGETATR